ncbi:fimbria/pilus outer membrane usher protein [Shigella flexneri]
MTSWTAAFFAGYRFSEENFMTMSEYLDAVTAEWYARATTKRCTPPLITRTFRDAGVGLSRLYRHTYWDERSRQTTTSCSRTILIWAVFVMSASR